MVDSTFGEMRGKINWCHGTGLQESCRTGDDAGMKAIRATIALLTLAACGEPSVVMQGPPVPAGSADTCGASAYGSLVGQDATALEKVLIMRQIRIIRPGQAVTMDYSAERINFLIGNENQISQITCG
jgi:hypothetical protein